MSAEWSTVAASKCLLAGEHAVMRGHPALVAPWSHHTLTLTHTPGLSTLVLTAQGDQAYAVRLLFWGVLEQALLLLGRDHALLKGCLRLENTIPVGKGLGFSAALAVVLSRWLGHLGWLPADGILSFARRLEDLFHQSSSGVDVAGVSSTGVMRYVQDQPPEACPLAWHPHLYLYPTTYMSVTHECVERVRGLWASDANRAAHWDEVMHEAVVSMMSALATPGAVGALAGAMHRACEAFRGWGLVTDGMDVLMKRLLDSGALAVKPTGAGLGGWLLVLADSDWAGDGDTTPQPLTLVSA